MLQDLRRVVTTWPFLASVLVMVINDAWLKGAYPGIVSGKLSDFAGIAVVSFLLVAAQPRRARLIHAVIILGFAWWKSPLSQPAIDAANVLLPLPVGRAVDYSDLLALSIIPLCTPVTANPTAYQIPGLTFRKLLFAPIVALTSFGLMATSVIRVQQDYQIRRLESSGPLDRQLVADTVSRVARTHGLECVSCDAPMISAKFEGSRTYLEYSFVGDHTISFKVQSHPPGMFSKPGKEADELRADLKRRLASWYSDLEYVEPLGAGR